MTNTKVDVKAGVNLDTSSLGTIQSTISAISPKMLVKAGVDKSQVDGYQPSDKNSKVKYKVDSSAVDAFKPANKNATVTYSVVVTGQGNIRETRPELLHIILRQMEVYLRQMEQHTLLERLMQKELQMLVQMATGDSEKMNLEH